MYVDSVASYNSYESNNKKNNKINNQPKNVSNDKKKIENFTEHLEGKGSTDGEKNVEKVDYRDNAVALEIGNDAKEEHIARVQEENRIAEDERKKTREEIKKAQFRDSEVKFGIHEKTERITIKIVDKETKEVLKEFPPEKSLDIIAKNMEIAGAVLDTKL